jgi:hypothetical protein
MKLFYFPLCVVGILSLSACSMTLPVRGQIQGTGETFTGTATGRIDGGGFLKIVSSQGTVCEGNFAYTSGREGKGIFNCDDGRSGPFEFVSTGLRGTGFGELENERMTFTFGKAYDE